MLIVMPRSPYERLIALYRRRLQEQSIECSQDHLDALESVLESLLGGASEDVLDGQVRAQELREIAREEFDYQNAGALVVTVLKRCKNPRGRFDSRYAVPGITRDTEPLRDSDALALYNYEGDVHYMGDKARRVLELYLQRRGLI